MLGLDVVTTFENNKEEIENIPKKQASPKHRNVMGETNN
jgi:hypothetical protein